jgi:hypothetical protein
MSDLAPNLDDLNVLGPDGVAVRLGTLWADQPVLLALIRHFG